MLSHAASLIVLLHVVLLGSLPAAFASVSAPPMMMKQKGVSQTPFAVPALELSPSPGLESCCSHTSLDV